MPITSRQRATRFLVDWNAADGLDESGNLFIRSGQTPSFTRGGTPNSATAIDANGRVYTPGVNSPRFHHQYDAGSGLYLPVGPLLEGARTNVALWCRDLTHTAWTKTNVTVAKTQTGMDGLVNSASLLTATAGNGTCLQAVTLASSTRAQSAYVQRVTGTGVIDMTTDGGATWNVITVTAAWTRVSLSQAAVTNPSFGFRLVTNGDAIAVDFVQNETGEFASSPIPTTNLAVTRTGDDFSLTPFNAPPSAMTMYAKTLWPPACASTSQPAVIQLCHLNGLPQAAITYYAAYARAFWENTVPTTVESTCPQTRTPGDTVETVAQISATGTIRLYMSINGAAAFDGGASGAQTLPAAWSGTPTDLSIGGVHGVPGYEVYAPISNVRIATGVQTMAFMQAA